ncbi:MAG: amidohydrolase [Candidatus Bathyarchaeota archaeon]|nr:amidohydrolase [Candidatus Bathyarchaeota archaeon]MDH5622940.1 amidohydrolase [Candidatus Bathyarchaeota archaeon]MDH5635051.1 amidohydrolase [Candidatus Bathyarchaeota archaeon]MDH5701694.1 amidohydrolase [Candidatus Bathyarchaeota archaeon]
MELIIDGGTVVTMGSKGIVRDGVIVVENSRIVDVGKGSDLRRKYSGYEKINAKGKLVIPGLVNTHQHAAMSLLRGYADDCPLKEWLEKWIWPLEKHVTGRDIYVGALLTAVESIMGGTTTVNTMYHYIEGGNEAQAFAEAGLRGVVGHVCFSWRKNEDKKALRNLAKDWHRKKSRLIRVSVDPHAAYTVDPEYMKELREIGNELNEKYGSSDSPIMWHMHVAETLDEPEKIQQAFNVPVKGGVVEYLDSLGVLGNEVIAIHCVALTQRDIKILKKRGVKVSHNPISNLKLASGISPVPSLINAGVIVALGTDSPCSNNNADMFGVMKTAALLHKGIHKDPTLMPAEQVLRMATIEGAKALLWDKRIGSIEIGKNADLVIVDFKKPHLCPLFNEISHLVYSAGPSDVDTVLINGKIVMENRKTTTIDVHQVLEMAEKTKERLLARLGEHNQ